MTPHVSNRHPRVLVAPDKFRGTLSAIQAAVAISHGIAQVWPDAQIRTIPVADGGEGTVACFIAAGAQRRSNTVSGPLRGRVRANWAVREDTAIIEMAAASGLALITPSVTSALAADSFGTGELIIKALGEDVSTIVVAVGGSATTDGGTGALRALGARFLDSAGNELPPGGYFLQYLEGIDLERLDPRLSEARIHVYCDVASPLIGGHGAATVFGPQKGADPAAAEALEAGMTQFAAVVADLTGTDLRRVAGAGAAGGFAGGFHALLHAQLMGGFSAIAHDLELATQVSWADLVIVGEGSLDLQSLQGKAPVALAQLAAQLNTPVAAIAGTVSLSEHQLNAAGLVAAGSASESAGSSAAALEHPAMFVTAAAADLARSLDRR